MEPKNPRVTDTNTSEKTENITQDYETFSCYHFSAIDFEIADIYLGWCILICVLNALFSVTACLANLLVLVAIRRTPSLHSPSNTLLSGLALSDLGVGVLVHPLFFSQMFGKVTQNKNIFCEAGITVEVTANALCIISLLTVIAVSLDRYLALRLHLRYKELITIKRVIFVLVNIWIIGAFSGTLWLYKPDMVKGNAIIIILVCFSAATFCYFQIYRVVSRHYHHEVALKSFLEQGTTREQTINMASFTSHALSTFWVYCFIIVCYLPYLCVVAAITQIGLTLGIRFAYDITATLVFINSSLNPLVYCWRLRDIRKAVRKTAKLFVCADLRENGD